MIPDHPGSAHSSQVHAWFNQHGPDLTRRCRIFFRRLRPDDREEAVADTLASIFKYAARAATRGKLQYLTPFTLVMFFGRLFWSGRRMAGSRPTDMLSRAKGRPERVRALNDRVPAELDDPGAKVFLSETLAATREDSPFEIVRRTLDYPEILRRERVGPRARRVFAYLCQTHGRGSHKELARELGIVPGRVTQIKRQLARCLARHGYEPPATRRPGPDSGH